MFHTSFEKKKYLFEKGWKRIWINESDPGSLPNAYQGRGWAWGLKPGYRKSTQVSLVNSRKPIT